MNPIPRPRCCASVWSRSMSKVSASVKASLSRFAAAPHRNTGLKGGNHAAADVRFLHGVADVVLNRPLVAQ